MAHQVLHPPCFPGRNILDILKYFTTRNSGRFSQEELMVYFQMGYFLSCDCWQKWWLVEDRVHYTYKFLSFGVPLHLTKSKGTSPISGTNIRIRAVETLSVWISQLKCLVEGLLSKLKCRRIICVFTVNDSKTTLETRTTLLTPEMVENGRKQCLNTS